MAQMREIKRRIRGIQSIRQITNAMELVATAKLQKARTSLKQSRPYYTTVLENINDILQYTGGGHPLLEERPIKKSLYIVVTSDRGLAGGYNANVIQLAHQAMKERDSEPLLMVVGTKAKDHFSKRGFTIHQDFVGLSERPSFDDAQSLGDEAINLYRKKEIDEIILIYTEFESTLSSMPEKIRLLPTEKLQAPSEGKEDGQKQEGYRDLIEFEPSTTGVLDYLIPMYLNSAIFGALIEASASEQASRRIAMENATDNANDMIDDLQTNYNRARQAEITNEITEIVSGADALS